MLTLRHGGHRVSLTAGAIPISTTQSDVFPYELNLSTYGNVDQTTEKVVAGWMYSTAALSAGTTLTLTHVSKSGVTIDQLTLTASVAANTSVDISALAATTGNTLAQGWTMSAGDAIVFQLATGGTNAQTGGVGVAMLMGVPS